MSGEKDEEEDEVRLCSTRRLYSVAYHVPCFLQSVPVLDRIKAEIHLASAP